MRFNHYFLPLMVMGIVMVFSSCKKEQEPGVSQLYGRWKTSYGDTITFARENGKDILTYGKYTNATSSSRVKIEFNFSRSGLQLDDVGAGDFRKINTFEWRREGREFTVMQADWFLYISALNTFYRFSRMD